MHTRPVVRPTHRARLVEGRILPPRVPRTGLDWLLFGVVAIHPLNLRERSACPTRPIIKSSMPRNAVAVAPEVLSL
jgi:hypothetical protein